MLAQENASQTGSGADLQNAINASKQMYDAACNRLGVPNDLEDESQG